MKIAYASDLHLDHNPSIPLSGLPAADVLVLAGDVDTMPEFYTETLRKVRLSFSGPILFVLGNHEYDHSIFPDVRLKYREAIAHDAQAYLLENESLVLGGVRFLGATLWTDFDGGKHMPGCQHTHTMESPEGGMVRTETILKTHRESVAWLEKQFALDSIPTVVITHHAPSLRSQPKHFTGTQGYCSNLDAHIQRWKPDVWIHGHLHDTADYRIENTRILCNPWGYPDEERAREFKVVETG